MGWTILDFGSGEEGNEKISSVALSGSCRPLASTGLGAARAFACKTTLGGGSRLRQRCLLLIQKQMF